MSEFDAADAVWEASPMTTVESMSVVDETTGEVVWEADYGTARDGSPAEGFRVQWGDGVFVVDYGEAQ